MRRDWIVGALAVILIAIALFSLGFSASFPIARTVDERAMAALVERFPPGSSYSSAVEYLATHYHEFHLGLFFPPTEHAYIVYAGGIPGRCESQAKITIRGASGTIHAWFYNYNDRMLCRQLLWLAPNFRSELSGHQTEVWACESDIAFRTPWWAELAELHTFRC